MSDLRNRTLKTNGIDMYVTQAGDPDGKPVICVHGFPELGRSWRKQLPALAGAGYHAIAPDMRGYGRTTAPKDVEAYRVTELCKDLCGLLDEIGVEKAAFVGHDWGAWMMWFMSMLHPERVDNLTNLSVAYAPRSATPPIATMRQIFGDIFFYMVYFQDIGPAETELGEDVRKTVLRFAWSVSGAARANDAGGEFASRMTMKYGEGGFLDQLADPPEGLASMPWFTQEDLDHFVDSFEHSTYFGPVSWYRNIDRNWEDTPQLEGKAPTMPVQFIAGTNDPVLMMLPPDPMRDTVPDLRDIVLVEGAGHWVHMERPDEVNAPLLKFLADVGY